MNFIQHRVNKIEELKTLNPLFGAEIDLRSDLNKLSEIHLSHDVWSRGDSLTKWLETYKKLNIKGTIIFNTKEDGLEETVLDLTKKIQIDNFFFLDTAFPTLVRFVNSGLGKHFATRVSQYENLEMVTQFEGKLAWVWADCFHGDPLPKEVFLKLNKNFKVCLVSPELQKMPIEHIENFKHLKPEVHSICTKKAEYWR